jgi:hypothetical protein
VEKTTYQGAIWSILLIKYYSVYQIKKNWMGGACNTYGGRAKVYKLFWWGDIRNREHLDDIGVVGG